MNESMTHTAPPQIIHTAICSECNQLMKVIGPGTPNDICNACGAEKPSAKRIYLLLKAQDKICQLIADMKGVHYLIEYEEEEFGLERIPGLIRGLEELQKLMKEAKSLEGK